jgi:hypothetical protein
LAAKFPSVIAVITVAPLCVIVPLNVFAQVNTWVQVLTSPRENSHASGRLKV